LQDFGDEVFRDVCAERALTPHQECEKSIWATARQDFTPFPSNFDSLFHEPTAVECKLKNLILWIRIFTVQPLFKS